MNKCTPTELVRTNNGASLCHQVNAVLRVKTGVNADMVTLMNLGAGGGLARGEQCEDIKKRDVTRKKRSSKF